MVHWFSQDHAHVAVVGVGKAHSADVDDPLTSLEDIDVGRQNIRSAAAGLRSFTHVILFSVHVLAFKYYL